MVAAYSNYLNWGIVGEIDAKHQRDIEKSKRDFSLLIGRTLEKLDEKNIPFLIIAQPPRMNKNVADQFLVNETQGIKYLGEKISLLDYKDQIKPLIESVPEKWHKNLVSLKDVYCPNEICDSIKNGALLYKDYHHISNDYAYLLSSYFTPIFIETLRIRQ